MEAGAFGVWPPLSTVAHVGFPGSLPPWLYTSPIRSWVSSNSWSSPPSAFENPKSPTLSSLPLPWVLLILQILVLVSLPRGNVSWSCTTRWKLSICSSGPFPKTWELPELEESMLFAVGSLRLASAEMQQVRDILDYENESCFEPRNNLGIHLGPVAFCKWRKRWQAQPEERSGSEAWGHAGRRAVRAPCGARTLAMLDRAMSARVKSGGRGDQILAGGVRRRAGVENLNRFPRRDSLVTRFYKPYSPSFIVLNCS